MIHVAGIGPGDPDLQVKKIDEIADKADRIYGTPRQLEALLGYDEKKIAWTQSLADLVEVFRENSNEDLLYLASGDPMVYGIGPYLIRELGGDMVQVYPGISSIQYLFAQLGLAMNDCYITSSHGRDADFALIAKMKKTAMVTDKKTGPYQIAKELLKEGLAGAQLVVGENLSYKDERIRTFDLDQVPDEDYGLAVVVVINEG